MSAVNVQEIISFGNNLKAAINNLPPFGLDNFPSVIKINAKDPEKELGRVINASAGNIIAAFGIDASNNFTVSFLPLDQNNKIIIGEDGEENWPAERVTNFPEGLENYMP